MSLTLSTRKVFGLDGFVKNNVHYVDESTVVYPAGCSLVVYNTDLKTQKFIPLSPESRGISAMAFSPNRKYIAVAEKADEAIITIFDLNTLKKRKTLATKQVESQEYTALAFSPDGKNFASQGGAPEYNLILWVWEKSKVAATYKQPERKEITGVAFNPVDQNVVSVIGLNILKSLRMVDTTFKTMQPMLGKNREPGNCTCQQWMVDPNDPEKEKLVVGTDTGDLMYFEGLEIKGMLPPFHEANSVDSLVQYSKGFVVGGDGGMLILYERLDDPPYYRKGKQFRILDHICKVTNLAITQMEESLICSTDTNQIFTMPLSQADILKTEEMNFEFLHHPLHAGHAWRGEGKQPVTGMDNCIRKPILATCSVDQSVRIWNTKEMNCELTKYFQDEAYCISLHPSGHHVLVGFADKLRILNVLDNDIKPYAEFSIKSCQEARFSQGGQYFAAANGATIQIYNTYTCENLANLRGHNGKVKSLVWSPDDLKLVSAGLDGAVYEWSIIDFKRAQESVTKGVSYTCAVGLGDPMSEVKRTLVVGTDKMIKDFSDPLTLSKEISTDGAMVTKLCMSSNFKLVFMATDRGMVRAYRYPFEGDREYVELQAHFKPITRMAVGEEDTVLFTTSEDGTLSCISIRDKEKDKGPAKKEGGTVPLGEEVLVLRSELEERRSHTNDLETQVSELAKQNEMQLHLQEIGHKSKIEELLEKFHSERDEDKLKYELLIKDQQSSKSAFDKQLEDLELAKQMELSALEGQFQQKIMNELERYASLQQEKERLNDRWDEQNSALMDCHERVIAELTEEYEDKLHTGQEAIHGVQRNLDFQNKEFEETKFQLEEDADREIEQVKGKYEDRLRLERDVSLRLKGENGIMKKKFNSLSKDIKAQEEEIKELQDQKKQLYNSIDLLEKEIVSLRKEISERDETISDKERRIYDMKKKNQELEKFKFVLDFKIKEMKKQIEPRERELEAMKEQVLKMDKELERYAQSSHADELKMKNLTMKADGMQEEIQHQKAVNRNLQTHLSKVNFHIQEVAAAMQDPKKLKEAAKVLYTETASDGLMTKTFESSVEEENKKQREYLERTVLGLKKKMQKDMEARKVDKRNVLTENITLIREINELRRDLKATAFQRDRARQLLAENGFTEEGHKVRSPRIKSRGKNNNRMYNSLGSENSLRESFDTPGGSWGGGSLPLSRESVRPLTQQFGPAPRWGEPRLPPRPLSIGGNHERDLEINRLYVIVAELESRLAMHGDIIGDITGGEDYAADAARLPPLPASVA